MLSPNKKRVTLTDVSKTFNVGYSGGESMLARIKNTLSGMEPKCTRTALDAISFEVSEGEILGLVGKNGSGKSTLLRIIAGIYTHDSGAVCTEGRVLYVHGFNHGTKPRLTMRENIYLIGSIFGLETDEVKDRFDEIVAFADLHTFVDTKVYQFSSGMLTRLNFSIFIHCVTKQVPEILLLDEILSAGGDAAFRKKAEAKIQELVASGTTVIMTSHNLPDIEQYCSSAVWMDAGSIKASGTVADVLSKYKSSI